MNAKEKTLKEWEKILNTGEYEYPPRSGFENMTRCIEFGLVLDTFIKNLETEYAKQNDIMFSQNGNVIKVQDKFYKLKEPYIINTKTWKEM